MMQFQHFAARQSRGANGRGHASRQRRRGKTDATIDALTVASNFRK
jgi:hypothetical protein